MINSQPNGSEVWSGFWRNWNFSMKINKTENREAAPKLSSTPMN